MNTFLLVVVIALSLILLVSLAIIIGRAKNTDRLLAVQLVGTVGLGILLVFAVLMQQRALLDTAFILVLLAVLLIAVFAHRKQGG